MDCPELKVAAEDFFQLHFTEVYKLDEFLLLDVSQLTHLLHQDKLTVRAEAQVQCFIAVLKYHSSKTKLSDSVGEKERSLKVHKFCFVCL